MTPPLTPAQLRELFLDALKATESGGSPDNAWGDGKMAIGPYQQHPSFYASWGPYPQDFGGRERTWLWAWEFAVNKFYSHAIVDVSGPKTPVQIAMAYHLHGQLRWDGWDNQYATDFQDAYYRLMPSEQS
jgi:hypothetical protein